MSLPAELRNRIWEDVFEGSIQELHGADYVIYRMLWDWKYCSKPVQLLLTVSNPDAAPRLKLVLIVTLIVQASLHRSYRYLLLVYHFLQQGQSP